MTVYVSLKINIRIINQNNINVQKKCDVYILWALQHNDSVCISQHNSIINKKLTCKRNVCILL